MSNAKINKIAKIAKQFALDIYPNQIEVISSEKMHQWAYASRVAL
ncbi:SpoVR family protein [Psychromonas sp. Urea-02u-13]|nr:SpoVR family protein [Psychromonas sp. Urea-02u-13]